MLESDTFSMVAYKKLHAKNRERKRGNPMAKGKKSSTTKSKNRKTKAPKPLKSTELKKISGGYYTDCRGQSNNVEDERPR